MTPDCSCRGIHRRTFLADVGMGFTGLALGAMLHQGGAARGAAPPRRARAKSVIWLLRTGGVTPRETSPPKPMLTKSAGKTTAETPFKDTQDPKKLKLARVVVVNDANGQQRNRLFPTQVGF